MEPPVTKSWAASTKQDGRGRRSAPKSPVASHAVVEYQRTGFRIGIDTFSHCPFLRFGQRPCHGRIGLHNFTAPTAGTDHCGALAKRERSRNFAVTCSALADRRAALVKLAQPQVDRVEALGKVPTMIALQDCAILATVRPSLVATMGVRPRLSSGPVRNPCHPKMAGIRHLPAHPVKHFGRGNQQPCNHASNLHSSLLRPRGLATINRLVAQLAGFYRASIT